MAIRYIGSKARLADAILDTIGDPSDNSFRFVDAFCGTGVVSKAAALRGWSVVENDSLLSSAYLADAALLCEGDLDFSQVGSYETAVAKLNNLQPIEGFIWKTYSPASINFCPYERRYFTERNAGKIDAVRNQISLWHEGGLIGPSENCLLVADLLEAASGIANIAGTYGCFLKKWTQQSQGELAIKERDLMPQCVVHKMSVGDVFDIKVEQHDVVYLDPPYTKRQYASYYHIPETIAYHDEPSVEGVAGLRPWKHNASPFCYKSKALQAIYDCVNGLSADRIYLSYSSQGHVELSELVNCLAGLGGVRLHSLGEIGRYRPNRVAASKEAVVEEYLIEVDKAPGD